MRLLFFYPTSIRRPICLIYHHICGKKGFRVKTKPLVKSDMASEAIWRLLLIRCEKIKNNQKNYHMQKILAVIDLLGFAAGKKQNITTEWTPPSVR